MTFLRNRSIGLVLAVVVLGGSACVADDPTSTSPDPTDAVQADARSSADEVEGVEPSMDSSVAEVSGLPESVRNVVPPMLAGISEGYRKVEGVWPGFVPNEHPTAIPIRDGDSEVFGALLLNHPDPEAVGKVTTLDVTGTAFDSAHFVTEFASTERLDKVDGFEFNSDVGGIDSFIMIADSSDEYFFDPLQKDYVATLLHEMFHRYQGDAFAIGSVGQDVEGYDYSAENFELAVLEEQALKAALGAANDSDRKVAAQHFAALRVHRLDRDKRVALDNAQEVGEGTARYLEHAFAGNDTEFTYHSTNFDFELTDTDGVQAKDWLGFGRWYASGAAAIQLLNLFGVDDIEVRIEKGDSPAMMLAEELDVDGSIDELVAEARAKYDPSGSLPEQAAEAAERAKIAPPIFGGPNAGAFDGEASEDTGFDDDDFDDGGSEGAEISNKEIACLEERGYDLNENNVEIDEADFEACLP